jgi:MOSC domain-containing protein YiiM
VSDPHVVELQVALAARMDMRPVESIRILDGHGITGDRYENARHRQVTVQSLEEIADAEAEVGRSLEAIHTRRNITLSAGRLDRTPGARLRIGGDVELEVVRDAAPCKLLEDNMGRDAKLALHKRAGVVYRTITGGTIQLGDQAAEIS